MPIMAMAEQSDARGAARVLATTVKKCVDQHRDAGRYQSSFRNMYHLLEAYKSHAFVPLGYLPSAKRGPESLNILPAADEHVDDLRVALEHALDVVYAGDREHGLESVERVLRSIAYPGKIDAPEGEERNKTSEFLGSFIDSLYARH